RRSHGSRLSFGPFERRRWECAIKSRPFTTRARPAPSRVALALGSRQGPAKGRSPAPDPDTACMPGPSSFRTRDTSAPRFRTYHPSAALEVLATAELAPLRRGLAIDLDKVQREVNRRSVAQARANAEAVDACLQECGYRLLVHGARRENLHVLVAAEVQFPTHFADNRGE